MFNQKWLLVFLGVTLGFTSCPAPQNFPLTGTVSVPAGFDVKNTIVVACNIETCTNLYKATAEVITIGASGLNSYWRIDLLAPGKYQVFAVNTAQGLTGIYKTPDGSSIVQAPFENINITLQKNAATQVSDVFSSIFSNPTDRQ
jgi:hypothetical protein